MVNPESPEKYARPSDACEASPAATSHSMHSTHYIPGVYAPMDHAAIRPDASGIAASQINEIQVLLDVLPGFLTSQLSPSEKEQLVEIILDLGRPAEIRLLNGSFRELGETAIEPEHLQAIVSNISEFSEDNRSGITRTLHRISAIRNRRGDVVGLTCRVGRILLGTIEPIQDIVRSGKSILLLGRPGVGKTTKLREIAKLLANEEHKRVVIVDTSNEIAGDGDIPHPVVGRARRMQVKTPLAQQAVMIEAVENHMPEVIIVDEIGTEEEARAARTIAERGVNLIATAHGSKLENIIKNPILADLVGGIQSVTLGDEEARRRGTQKTILEREKAPTFEVAIELRDRDTFAVYLDIAKTVDETLRGFATTPEIRRIDSTGQVKVLSTAVTPFVEPRSEHAYTTSHKTETTTGKLKRDFSAGLEPVQFYLYAITKSFVERIIERLSLQHLISLTTNMHEAHGVLVLRGHTRPGSKVLRMAADFEIPCFYSKTNTMPQIQRCLREALEHIPQGQLLIAHIMETAEADNNALAWLNSELLKSPDASEEIEDAIIEVQAAIQKVLQDSVSQELSPRRSYIRRLQHDYVEKQGLMSISIGAEPERRLKILKS
jgi:stage III sporulation protein SpoIIIAA